MDEAIEKVKPIISKRKKIIIVSIILISILVVLAIVVIFISQNKDIRNDILKTTSISECPSNLQGIITYPIMDKGTIKALTPLGNSNPPGHTFPVDHIYFEGERDGTKYNVYPAGDGYITQINLEEGYRENGELLRSGVTITIEYCKGVELVIAVPGTLSPLTESMVQDLDSSCKTMDGKHTDEASIRVCGYQLFSEVKADDVIAITGGGEWPEIWALNKNITLSDDVDWERYNSPYYQYAFCFFDMYPQELKDYYYTLFGRYESIAQLTEKNLKEGKELPSEGIFTPRTIPPLCGKVMQNIVGTVKGDWFGEGRDDYAEGVENTYDLALIEDNVDPTYERIVIGGNISEPGLLEFMPVHEGNINRIFEEVTADNQIYCYQADNEIFYGWWPEGKIVLQLIDDNHLKIEKQDGECTGNEVFINPKNYDR